MCAHDVNLHRRPPSLPVEMRLALPELERQRERMIEAATLADKARRPDLAYRARHYAARLRGLATMATQRDPGFVSGMIGRNGWGPDMDIIHSDAVRAFSIEFPASPAPSPCAGTGAADRSPTIAASDGRAAA